MKVNELVNLYVGIYTEPSGNTFKVLICAIDEYEALEVFTDYCYDANIYEENDAEWQNNIIITPFEDINTNFDCDYVINSGDNS